MRNLLAEVGGFVPGLAGLRLWVGSRMYRGNDIYLLDYWPLDNLNTIGGGAIFTHGGLDLRLHVGVNRLDDDCQHQVIQVSGARFSSDGGLLLLRRAESAVLICEKLAALLPDDRDQDRVVHSRLEQVKQRVFNIACGFEDCNDADSLKTCPNMIDLVSQTTPRTAWREQRAEISRSAAFHRSELLGDLYRRRSRTVFRFASRMLLDVPLGQVEDPCQEVFLAMFKAALRYHEEGKFTSWLLGITMRRVRD